jgi:hypothetical protein
MKLKEAQRILLKAHQLVELVADHCMVDENYFAQGMDGDKWVAWILMIPGHEIMAFDVADGSKLVGELRLPALDRLLNLRWKAPKPMNPLELLARTAAIDDVHSGPGSITVIDGEGKGITDAPQADAAPGITSIQGAEDR